MKNRLLRAGVMFWGLLFVLLLGILLLSLTGAINMSFPKTWSAPAELIREETFDLRELASLAVQGRAEGIKVVLVSGDVMTVRQYGNPNKDAAFTDNRTGAALTLKIPNQSWFNWFNWGEKRLEVDLPVSYAGNLDLSSVSGEISCPEGFTGRTLSLDTTSGRITLGAVTVDALTLDTVSGGISLGPAAVNGYVKLGATSGAIRAADIWADQVSLSTVSGSIRAGTLTLEGRAVIDTTSGSVQVGGLFCREYDIETVSGRITVETALSGCGRLDTTSGGVSASGVSMTGAVTINTVSGGVTVNLAAGQSCELKLSSVSGGVHCNAPLNNSDDRSHKVTGTIGAGGPLLSVSTTSGGITVNQ